MKNFPSHITTLVQQRGVKTVTFLRPLLGNSRLLACPRVALATLLITLPIMAATTSGCGYNRIQARDEQVSSSWADVLNQYKRRADLIPNLVNTVKGYAEHEKETLEAVVAARAKATSFNLPADSLSDPQKLQEFQAVQSELGSALSRLLVISENYPSLKADQSFRDLQAQLEGTENRITVARTRFIESVKEYNTTIRSFPVNLTAKMFGYKGKETFTVADVKKIEEPPAVAF